MKAASTRGQGYFVESLLNVVLPVFASSIKLNVDWHLLPRSPKCAASFCYFEVLSLRQLDWFYGFICFHLFSWKWADIRSHWPWTFWQITPDSKFSTRRCCLNSNEDPTWQQWTFLACLNEKTRVCIFSHSKQLCLGVARMLDGESLRRRYIFGNGVQYFKWIKNVSYLEAARW